MNAVQHISMSHRQVELTVSNAALRMIGTWAGGSIAHGVMTSRLATKPYGVACCVRTCEVTCKSLGSRGELLMTACCVYRKAAGPHQTLAITCLV